MELRTDRVGCLLDQLASTREFSEARLAGMTDDEFLWEPAQPAWSIRRREDATTPGAYGPGEWLLDFESPEPDPAPVSTIAWRIGHIASMLAGRYEWTFGGRSREPKDLVDFRPEAAPMLALVWEGIDRWSQAIDEMTDEQLDTPGFGQYPYGLDPQLPFIGIVWWMNREMIHHLAEVALLRDLYLHRAA